jgi:tRNA A-37 threonylcarbamoyl transferase component Bud32
MGETFKGDKLTTLPQARDPRFMQGVLAPFFLETPIDSVEVEILARRKRRCVLRYRLQSGDGTRKETTLIAKVYKASRGAPVSALMQRLWQAGFDRTAADHIAIPEVVAYLPDLSLILQEEVGGRPVGELLRTPDAEHAVRRMGCAISKLHRSPLRLGEPYALADYLRRCHPTHEVLGRRVPEVSSAIDEIVHESHRLLSSYAACQPTLIHGDLHMAQIHVAPERTWMIDFDACATGDPAADLGNVLVFLKEKKRTVPQVPRLVDAFLDEYFKSMPGEILMRVPLFEALTNLRRACKRLRLGEKNWRKRVRRSIDAGLQQLAVARG